MADIQLRGLRLWVSSLIHWPGRQLQARLEGTEQKLEGLREDIQAELERRALLFEKIFAVVHIAANVILTSANCFHPFSIEALPISVSPAKQNRRCTQKTCKED